MLRLYNGDCLKIMKDIKDKSVDFIYTDLPYATTQNSWDILIPLEPLWAEYSRILKDNGCVALWSQMPFSAQLVMSNPNDFRYEWIIEKTKGTGFLNAKRMPMKCHENVLIFYKKLPTYNPQKTTGHTPVHAFTKHSTDGTNYGKTHSVSGGGSTERYPRDVIQFKWDTQKSAVHPTQKPISAAEYFIKTYTNEGDTVLDSCMGSGSTGVACARLGRNFIGIEKDEKYFNISIDRFRAEGLSNKLPLVKFDNFADIIVLEADLRKQNDLQ